MSQYLQFFISGLTTGSIYALIAFGFALVYRTTKIINLAHGELCMLGAMVAISTLAVFHPPLWVAFLASMAVIALLGLLIERIIIRPSLTAGPINALMVTIALAIVIQGGAMMIWGEDAYRFPYFTGGTPIMFLGAAILPQALWTLGSAILISVLFWLFFNKTQLGIAMRACSDDPLGASLVGINRYSMVKLAFVLAAVLGAISGMLVAPLVYVTYFVGITLTIKGFVAAIVGGINRNLGVITGGLALGMLESFTAGLLPSEYKEVFTLLLVIILLCLRPSGIIGESR